MLMLLVVHNQRLSWYVEKLFCKKKTKMKCTVISNDRSWSTWTLYKTGDEHCMKQATEFWPRMFNSSTPPTFRARPAALFSHHTCVQKIDANQWWVRHVAPKFSECKATKVLKRLKWPNFSWLTQTSSNIFEVQAYFFPPREATFWHC